MPQVYRVRPGDTLTAIANRNHTSLNALATANQIYDVNLVHVGQTLQIPDGSGPHGSAPGSSAPAHTYTVRSGDTLTSIAKRFHVTVPALLTSSHLRNANHLTVGQILHLPASAPSAAPGGSVVSHPASSSSHPTHLSSHTAPAGQGHAPNHAPGSHQSFPVHGGTTQAAATVKAPQGNMTAVAQGTGHVAPSPVAAASGELGILSRKYEAQGPGTVSKGTGDAGGVSYGSYQVASKTGTAKEFIAYLKGSYPAYYGVFAGKTPGSDGFTSAWKALAKQDPTGFFNAQHAFVKLTHYDPIVAEIRALTGLDVTTRSKALQDVTWSTAVQHRHGADHIYQKALNGHDPATLTDEQIIRAVYAERGRKNIKGALAHFSGCSAQIQAGVAKRYVAELKDALAELAGNHGGSGPKVSVIVHPSAPAKPPSSGPHGATDGAIEALDLNPAAKKAAYALKKAQPSVVFTSGRRDLAGQASAMASNVVSNRQWIAQTYASNSASIACQNWVDHHPEATTRVAISAGLLATLHGLGDAAGQISKHLTGAAFDVQPVTASADKIKASIRALPGLTKFLEKEGGLIRWHAQF